MHRELNNYTPFLCVSILNLGAYIFLIVRKALQFQFSPFMRRIQHFSSAFRDRRARWLVHPEYRSAQYGHQTDVAVRLQPLAFTFQRRRTNAKGTVRNKKLQDT